MFGGAISFCRHVPLIYPTYLLYAICTLVDIVATTLTLANQRVRCAHWAHSEGHPCTEGNAPELWWIWGTFAGTLVNVREVLVNMVLWVRQSSPKFAMLCQSSHEGARMLLVHPGACLNWGPHPKWPVEVKHDNWQLGNPKIIFKVYRAHAKGVVHSKMRVSAF